MNHVFLFLHPGHLIENYESRRKYVLIILTNGRKKNFDLDSDIRQKMPFNFSNEITFHDNFNWASIFPGIIILRAVLYLSFRHIFIRNCVCYHSRIRFSSSAICLMLDRQRERRKERKKLFHQVERSCTFIAQSTVSINCLYCQLHSNDDSTSFSRLSAEAHGFLHFCQLVRRQKVLRTVNSKSYTRYIRISGIWQATWPNQRTFTSFHKCCVSVVFAPIQCTILFGVSNVLSAP